MTIQSYRYGPSLVDVLSVSSSGLSFGLVFLGNLGRILGVELIVNGLATGLLSIGGGVGVGLLDARGGIRVYKVTDVVRSATVRIFNLGLSCHSHWSLCICSWTSAENEFFCSLVEWVSEAFLWSKEGVAWARVSAVEGEIVYRSARCDRSADTLRHSLHLEWF